MNPNDLDFPKAYIASEHEASTYEAWESSGAFQPSGDGAPFSIVMPPPNANGNLHMGHALMIPLEDIMVRWHRMMGDKTLWVPGSDHAGIETQVMFEKKLEKEGRSRFQMDREQFMRECLQFTQENKTIMEGQVRALGASADWSTERFTLDQEIVDQVYETFRQMRKDGLIYRGERIVNYSVKYRTAYSDIEVEHEERQEPLYYIKYGPITVATVRPETKFGDKTIVVHPEDDRYKQYIGQSFMAMTASGEEMEFTVIADDVIKPEFGTGAMTITPAHDPIDFEIAKRHNLPINKVIGLDGKMLPIAGEFAGMKVAEARVKVGEKMIELGMVEKVDRDYRHTIGLCYKSHQPIEPMLMPQWYVSVRPLADKAIEAIEQGKVRFHPEGYKRIQLDWLKGLRDWNISRQIWWGIPIAGADPSDPEVANDPDTFDTWFSSGQWPYATMEAAGKNEFYPNSVMETGHDLIFSWITRMLMLGLYRKNDVPFRDVYLHGMVVDTKGKKMSKSKNNGVNPMEMIAKYGADAVRFGLVVGSSAGSNIPMPEEKLVGGRNFANKLWNMSRFTMMQLDGRLPSALPAVEPQGGANMLVLDQLRATIKETNNHLENFRFAQALQAVHEFAWHQFADVYIEEAKNQKGEDGRVTDATCAILWETLTTILKLAHPFMPFVTEAIWKQIGASDKMLIVESWPKA